MRYNRNEWYVACAEADLAKDEPVAAHILNERIVLWRAGDKVVALEDRCVHRAAALSLGRCEGANLRCMYHGLLFDGAGVVVEIPGQDAIPPHAKIRAYPVTTRFGWAWVWMGDAAKADPCLLPDLPGVSLDDFAMTNGVLDYDAEAQLLSDNLLDFSHLPFVHGASFQASRKWSDSPMSVTTLERGVRFGRWVVESEGPHFLYGTAAEPVDEWLGYDYLIPGVLLMWVGIFRAGTARALNFKRPDFSTASGRVNVNIQAVTPARERKARYFFATGLHRELGGGKDPSLVKRNLEVTLRAFNEDKRTIEMQQKVIDCDPDRPMMPTIHDRGVTLYHRLKGRLLEMEQTAALQNKRSQAPS